MSPGDGDLVLLELCWSARHAAGDLQAWPALRLDLHLRGAPSGQIRPFAVGRLGAVSYEVFKLGVTGRIVRPLQRVVRLEDLNVAHFEKTPQLPPEPA